MKPSLCCKLRITLITWILDTFMFLLNMSLKIIFLCIFKNKDTKVRGPSLPLLSCSCSLCDVE